MVCRIEPAADIVHELVRDADTVIRRMTSALDA
jgi:hypothetical protein